VKAERETARNGKWRVLVMDDEDLVRDMEIGMLEHLGCERGGPGTAARRSGCTGTPPWVGSRSIWSSWTSPSGKDGREGGVRLHAGDVPDAKVIVCSGYSADPVMSDHSAYGFQGMLGKPFHMEELKRVLEKVLASPSGRQPASRMQFVRVHPV